MAPKTANSVRRVPRRIVIVAYEGVKLMDVSGPLQAFSDTRFEDGRPAYEVTLGSEAGGAVSTDTGVKLETRTLDAAVLSSADTLLVAGSDLIMPPIATASLRAR